MNRNIFQFIESRLGRRAFVQRMSAVGSAFVAGVFGVSKQAVACDAGCCNLCVLPYDAGCTRAWCLQQSGAKCMWDWLCNDNVRQGKSCHQYRCSECFAVLPANCAAPCPTSNTNCRVCTIQGVICSNAEITIQKLPDCQED